MSYILHYAPDNASMIVRLALEQLNLPYRAQLVDRSVMGQQDAAYLALNPNGLIPVLETPTGPLFETGAILLWLADTHGGLGPAPHATARGDFLRRLQPLISILRAVCAGVHYIQQMRHATGLIWAQRPHWPIFATTSKTYPVQPPCKPQKA
jgi:glutathione S-transferase